MFAILQNIICFTSSALAFGGAKARYWSRGVKMELLVLLPSFSETRVRAWGIYKLLSTHQNRLNLVCDPLYKCVLVTVILGPSA